VLFRSVDGSLSLQEKYNRKLGTAVIAYLDDEGMHSGALGKLKHLVTSDVLEVRRMNNDATDRPNHNHFIFCCNSLDLLPIKGERQDSRFVIIEVPPLFDEDKIDWLTKMKPALESEASDFLGTLLSINLRPAYGRLYLPVLETEIKRQHLELPEFNPKELATRVDAMIRTKIIGADDAEIEDGKIKIGKEKFIERLGEGSWSHRRSAIRDLLDQSKNELQALGIQCKVTKRLIWVEGRAA